MYVCIRTRAGYQTFIFVSACVIGICQSLLMALTSHLSHSSVDGVAVSSSRLSFHPVKCFSVVFNFLHKTFAILEYQRIPIHPSSPITVAAAEKKLKSLASLHRSWFSPTLCICCVSPVPKIGRKVIPF